MPGIPSALERVSGTFAIRPLHSAQSQWIRQDVRSRVHR